MTVTKSSSYLLLSIAILIFGCAGGIQKTYWQANTSVALDEEKKGNIEQAEIELLLALKRAQNHLAPEDVSNSLYNLGVFYARQERTPDAIKQLQKSIELEETLSGYTSIRTGRRIAALANVQLMEHNLNEGRLLAERLKPIASKFSGDELEMINYIIKAYEDKPEDYKKQLDKLKPLVEQGDAEAQYNLATNYEDGRGVERNMQKAIELYRLAANQDYTEAQYYLGVIYDKGRGVTSDDVKAREWYHIAANNGHSLAQYNYAIFLLQGRGGSVDKDEALIWLQKAAAQGLPMAKAALKEIDAK